MKNSNNWKKSTTTLVGICGFDFKIRLFVCLSMNGKDIWMVNINETKEVKVKIVGKKCK